MGNKKKGLTLSFIAGAIALAFVIVGYQTALLVHRAALSTIISNRDTPDTVYVSSNVSSNVSSGTSHQKSEMNSSEEVAQTVNSSRDKTESSQAGNQKKTEAKSQQNRTVARSEPNSEINKVYNPKKYKKAESFTFNPNNISHEDLMRLGFSSKQAQSIINYRDKGGRFARKSDFAKSFVVSESIYKRLEPYIDIPKIDLNLADSTTFDSLPGIGPYYAQKMVEQRCLLGTYSFKEQLMDIYRFDIEKYKSLEDLITINPKFVKPYPIWRLPEDSLKLHPYIGSYAARGIVLFRENHDKDKWKISELILAGIIKPEFGDKLSKIAVRATDQ